MDEGRQPHPFRGNRYRASLSRLSNTTVSHFGMWAVTALDLSRTLDKYGFGLTLFMGRRVASQRRFEPEKAKVLRSQGAVALFLAAATAFVIASEGSAEKGPDELNVQGGWAYTARGNDGAVEHVAATRAAEDATWLLLACSADGRLTVSLIHAEQFPFPLKSLSLVKLRSNNVPTALIEGKSVGNNLIFVDPMPMRHIMPLLIQDDELVVSIPDWDGAMHDYTFSMQPNDLALGPIRSHCFDF
jgi:hypothetical protein